VAPSVRRAWVSATVPAVVMLTGCVPTQRIAARARLVDARILASQNLPVVGRADPQLSVGRPVVIRGASGTAIVVSVRNDSPRVLTDLPISVGIRDRRGRPEYLNRSANLDYFSSHVAAIAPHAAVTWVFTSGRRVAPRTGAFATVGFPLFHPSLGDGLPQVVASADGVGSVSVTNRSGIPQYDLPVYAVATRAGREVAAGVLSVPHLGTHGRTTVTVNLLGNSRGAALRLLALPTIFN